MRVKKTSAGRSDKFGWSIYFQLAVILFIIIKIFNYLFWKKNRSIGQSFKRNPMIFIIPIGKSYQRCIEGTMPLIHPAEEIP